MLKALVGVVFLVTVLLAGCDTTKGAAIGAGAAVVSVADGVQKDYQTAKRIDSWMRKNMW